MLELNVLVSTHRADAADSVEVVIPFHSDI